MFGVIIRTGLLLCLFTVVASSSSSSNIIKYSGAVFPGKNQGGCNKDINGRYPPVSPEDLIRLCVSESETKFCANLPNACFDCNLTEVRLHYHHHHQQKNSNPVKI